MAVLGADIEQLATLATDCTNTGTNCQQAGTNVQTQSSSALDELNARMSTLVSQVETEMSAMTATVNSMLTQATGVSWTGTNRDTFVGAATDFQSKMHQAQTDTESYYQQIRSFIDVDFRGRVEEFVTALTGAMTAAQGSCDSMKAAVDAQAAAVDATMNTGLTVG